MIFIGIFGVGQKEDQKSLEIVVDDCQSPVLVRTCQHFHFFFVPLVRWGCQYAFICSDEKVLRLKDGVGESLWSGEKKHVSYWDYSIAFKQETCSHCGQPVEANHTYCPHCGNRVER